MYYLNVYSDGVLDNFFKFNTKEELITFCKDHFFTEPEFNGNTADVYF